MPVLQLLVASYLPGDVRPTDLRRSVRASRERAQSLGLTGGLLFDGEKFVGAATRLPREFEKVLEFLILGESKHLGVFVLGDELLPPALLGAIGDRRQETSGGVSRAG